MKPRFDTVCPVPYGKVRYLTIHLLLYEKSAWLSMGYFYRKKRIFIRNVGEFFRILSYAVDRTGKSGYNKDTDYLSYERFLSYDE